MAASLGEPYLLVDYDYPSTNLVHLDQVYVNSSHNVDGENSATISVQQDAVYVLDLTSSHPLSSINLSPSKLCTSPSISRIESGVGGQSIRATYIPVSSKGGKRKECSLSRWEQPIPSSSERLPKEQSSTKLPWAVYHLAFSTGLPNHILAFSEAGDLMVLNQKLSTTATLIVPNDSRGYLKTFIFDQSKRRFPQAEDDLPAVTAVSVFQGDHNCEFDILSISSDGGAAKRTNKLVQRVRGQIAEVTVNALGVFRILTTDGVLVQGEMVCSGKQLLVAPDVRITRFRTELFPRKSSKRKIRGFSMLGLTDSHLLLAMIPHKDEHLVQLLLWDCKFSVVLSSLSTAIPATLSSVEPERITISLISATSENCILSFSPIVESNEENRMSLHSVLMIVPFSCPHISTVATAMGCSRSTERWLQPESSSKTDVTGPGERSRVDMLKQISTALTANDVQKAEEAFFNWVASEESKLDGASSTPITFAKARYGRGKALAAPKLRPKKDSKSAVLPYGFMTQLLELMLAGDNTVPKKMMEYLLDRRLVSQSMVAGGVTNRLQKAGDWASIDLALKCISDLSEDDIASLLWTALAQQQPPATEDATSMDVDTGTQAPSLTRVLSRCLRYPISEASMRVALKRRFKDMRQLLPILDIFDNWLERWAERGPLIGFSLEAATLQEGAGERREAGKTMKNIEKRTGMPAPEHIIRFLRIILDGFFLQLLQTPGSSTILQRLQEKVIDYLTIQRKLESLRGPLEPFAKIIASSASESTPQKPEPPLPARPTPLKKYQIEQLIL